MPGQGSPQPSDAEDSMKEFKERVKEPKGWAGHVEEPLDWAEEAKKEAIEKLAEEAKKEAIEKLADEEENEATKKYCE